jgi:hypothetical protein
VNVPAKSGGPFAFLGPLVAMLCPAFGQGTSPADAQRARLAAWAAKLQSPKRDCEGLRSCAWRRHQDRSRLMKADVRSAPEIRIARS